jgi:hypothetical protein
MAKKAARQRISYGLLIFPAANSGNALWPTDMSFSVAIGAWKHAERAQTRCKRVGGR